MVKFWLLLSLASMAFCIPKSNFEYIEAGQLGVFYTVSDYRIEKYNSCKLTSFYNSEDIGKLTDFNSADYHRIIAFVEDQNLLLFLDKELDLIDVPLKLDELGLYSVSKLCASTQGGFWCFDKTENRIFRFGMKLEKQAATNNLSQFVSVRAEPEKIVEKGNKLFVFYKSFGLLIFDVFGNYSKTVHLPLANKVQPLSGEAVLYDSSDQLIKMNLKTNVFDTLGVRLNGRDFSASSKDLYLFRNDSVQNIKFN